MSSCCLYTKVQSHLSFFLCLFEQPSLVLITIYQPLEVLAKFGHILLWGIQLMYLCIFYFAASVICCFVSNEQMGVRMLIF
jgi:hypothetical protein